MEEYIALKCSCHSIGEMNDRFVPFGAVIIVGF